MGAKPKKGFNMLNKTISCLLVAMLVCLSTVQIVSATSRKSENNKKEEAKIAKRASEIETAVRKLGVSTESKVKVKLRDKTKISGFVSKIEKESFTVTDKNGQQHVIEYRSAKQIKGNNLHAGVWVAIGVGAAVLVMLVILGQLIDD